MASPISNGIALARKYFQILRNDKVLIRYPLTSMIGYGVVALVLLIIISGFRVFETVPTGAPLSFGQQLGIFLTLVAFYILNYMLSTFSSASLIGAIFLRVGGEEVTVADGYRLAVQRLPFLIGYAGLSATIGVVARAVNQFSRGKNTVAQGVINALLGSTIATAWNIISYLVIPVLLVENQGLFASMRRSAELFREAFNANANQRSSLGIVLVISAFLGALPGYLLAALGAASANSFLMIVGYILLFLAVGFITLMGGAINGILQASLYLYAVEGSTGLLLTVDEVKEAFRND